MSQKQLRTNKSSPSNDRAAQNQSQSTKINKKTLFIFFTLLLIIPVLYFIISNSNFYRMTQLDHLQDRIRFGRLQFKKKVNITVGKINVNNKNKIFNITFNEQQIFVGENQHFLIIMQGQAKISQKTVYQVQDDIKKICKVQIIQNIVGYDQNKTVIISGYFQDCPHNSKFEVILYEQLNNNDRLKIKVRTDESYNRLYTLFKYNVTDHYFGLGEQFSYLNLGHNRPFSTFIRAKGTGRGQQPLSLYWNLLHGNSGSYYTSPASMPIWFSSRKIGYMLHDYSYMAWINNKMLVWDCQYELTWFKRETFKQIVKEIAELNGYTKKLPEWVNKGAILGVQEIGKNLTEKYGKLKDAGAIIQGIYINYQNQSSTQWQKVKTLLTQNQIKTLTYANPYTLSLNLINNTQNNGLVLGQGQLDSIQQVHQSIQQAFKNHNKFPLNYLQRVNNILNENLGNKQLEKFVVISSSGYLNTPKYTTALSSGQHIANFNKHNGLPSCLTSILTSGLVGFANTYCNIGGDIDLGSQLIDFEKRTEILMVRWMQLAAFTSVFMTTQGKKINRAMGQDMLQVYSNEFLANNFAFYSNLFASLADYRKRQTKSSFQQKLPLIRPLFLQLDDKANTYEIQDQFYFGSEIMIAPYMSEQSQRVYFLSKGQWRSLWDGKIFKGCNCERIWKDHLPAAFIRSSSEFTQSVLKSVQDHIIKYKQFIFQQPTVTVDQL